MTPLMAFATRLLRQNDALRAEVRTLRVALHEARDVMEIRKRFVTIYKHHHETQHPECQYQRQE